MIQETRRIWLCADDYGMAPGVNDAIRQLIAKRRINATSVMTAASHLGEAETRALVDANAHGRALIGLHVTLTAPYKPLSFGFAPLRGIEFLPHTELMRLALTRRLNVQRLATEIAAQVAAFISAFGHPPAYLDGHQHVQLLPQVRDAFLQVAAEFAPGAWVRQCGRPRGSRALHDPKGLVIDILNVGFRNKALHHGITTNPAFAGAYAFNPNADFAKIFPRFLKGLPDGGLIMCHPGFIDDALKSLDNLTALREREFAYFNSDAFPAVLAAQSVELAHPSSANASGEAGNAS